MKGGDVRSELTRIFDRTYFEQRSTYAKFSQPSEAAQAITVWYQGLLALLDRRFPGALPIDGHVLEVGCGHGAILELLRRRGARPVGSDISSYAVEALRHADPIHPLLLSSAECLPIASDRLQGVVAFEVLEHLPSVQDALREIHRTLATGGAPHCLDTESVRERAPFPRCVGRQDAHFRLLASPLARTTFGDRFPRRARAHDPLDTTAMAGISSLEHGDLPTPHRANDTAGRKEVAGRSW